MMAAGVCVASSNEEAMYLRSSQILAFVRLRTGNPGLLPLPVEDLSASVPAQVLQQVNHALSCSACGAPDTVYRQFDELISRYQPDEIMVTGMIHDHALRVKSFDMAANVLKSLVSN